MGKFAKKLWQVERPELDNIVYKKGFKRNPYPAGSAPPLRYASKKGLMELFDIVENKKPAKGNVARYRKATETTKPFPPARKPGSTKPMTKMYKEPLYIPKGKRVYKEPKWIPPRGWQSIKTRKNSKKMGGSNVRVTKGSVPKS